MRQTRIAYGRKGIKYARPIYNLKGENAGLLTVFLEDLKEAGHINKDVSVMEVLDRDRGYYRITTK